MSGSHLRVIGQPFSSHLAVTWQSFSSHLAVFRQSPISIMRVIQSLGSVQKVYTIIKQLPREPEKLGLEVGRPFDYMDIVIEKSIRFLYGF